MFLIVREQIGTGEVVGNEGGDVGVDVELVK